MENKKDVQTVTDDRGWTVANSIVSFDQDDNDDGIDDGFDNDALDFNKNVKDNLKVIDNTLDYAINLETIV